jgi:hypothetical protein
MRVIIVAALAVISVCTGCVPKDNRSSDSNKSDTTHSENVEIKTGGTIRYLVVGMESSKRFGSCIGCEIDARRMNSLLSNVFGYTGDMLISSQATRNAVVSKLMDGIANTPEDGMFIFCYSGHGGQEYLGGKEPNGAEKQDEYLCLYDTYLQDDEIWEIVSRRKGRVFLYFDACHSATMYRSVASDKVSVSEGEARALDAGRLVRSAGFEFHPEEYVMAEALEAGNVTKVAKPGLLCWSGCKELEYSYGGSRGGVMTCALVNNWKKGMTYTKLWSLMVKDVQKEQPTQHPVQTNLGLGFNDNTEAFK